MADKIAKRGVSIFIDGTEVKNSVAGITSEMRKLEAQQKKMTIGSDEYVAHGRKIENLRSVLTEHKNNQKLIAQEYTKMSKGVDAYGKKHESVFSNAANWFNKYSALAVGAIATITGISLTFRKLAEDVAKMDDVYSDVMKTTGKTRKQVVELNEDFKKIDTRTSRESLNLLARDAGKLGKTSKQDILDFVEAGNQINVALGEDLGEDAIKNIGKMVGVFEKSTKQLQGIGLKEQMLSVGSAVNELGASSTASEPYLVAFAGRLGGISKQAKISMADILGFGSALDQDMQQVEMSATALQNFIMKLMGDPAKFARLAGLEVKGFTDLLNTDANSAIKQVLSSLNNKGGFQALIPIFQEMGLDGARATGVLSSLAGSIDKVEEAQQIANQAMADGTSISKEAKIKNENLAAQLDKAKNKFNETAQELGKSLNPMLLKSVNGSTYLIKTLVALPKWLKENKIGIIAFTAGLVAYIVALNAANIVTKVKLTLEAIDNALQTAKIVGLRLRIALTGQATFAELRLVAAQKALNASMMLNVYTAFAVAIAAIGIGIYKLATRTTDAQKAMTEFNKEAITQKRELNAIFEAYKKANPQTAEKARLLKIIKDKYGDYIKGLIDEKGNIIDIEKAQRQANKALSQSIALKVKNRYIDEYASKEIEHQADLMTKIRDRVKDAKGETLADLIVGEIGDIMNENITDPMLKGLPEIQKLLSKYGLMSGVLDRREFGQMTASLASSYYHIGKKTKEFDSVFKGLVGDASLVADAAEGIDTEDGNDNGNGNAPTGDKTKFDPQKFSEENRKLAKELADAAISDLEETLDFANYVQREQLAGQKMNLEQEHALKVKSLQDERQLELDKAEISATSAEEAGKKKRLINQKYKALIAEENAEFDTKSAEFDKKQQEKFLKDKLSAEAEGTEMAFNLEKAIREAAMLEELEIVEKGSKEEKSIRDKYRKMEEDAENVLLQKKQQMIFEYANAGLRIATNLNSFLTELDNAELSNFEKNNKDKADFDEEYAKKKAQLEYDAAVRSKVVGSLSAIISTSAAIIGALAPPPIGLGPIAGIPFAVAAGAEGALQLAAILAAPLPQLWTGGFTGEGGKYEPKGVVHGNEFVANSDALSNPNLMPIFKAIDSAQRLGTVKNLKSNDMRSALRQDSYHSNRSVRKSPVDNTNSQLEKLEKTIDKLNIILNDGIRAKVSASGNDGIVKGLNDYNKLIKNSKR